jgi:hypothetical protein
MKRRRTTPIPNNGKVETPYEPGFTPYRPGLNGDGKFERIHKSTGRPSLYTPEFHDRLAYRFISTQGTTDEHLAEMFGISLETYDLWKRTNPSFLMAVKTGRWDYDSGHVAKALVKRATGYTIEEKTYERQVNPVSGEPELVLTRVVPKHVPPDPTSMIFWLCNRQRDEWRREVKHSVEGSVSHDHNHRHSMLQLQVALKEVEPEALMSLRRAIEQVSEQRPTEPILVQ